MDEAKALSKRFDGYRARLWYQYLFSKSGWSDYRLDLEFGRDRDGVRRHAGNRSRMFGPVRRGRLPTRGDRYNRSFDLVELVERHETFKGSKAYFESPFWDVVTVIPENVVQAHDMVACCFDRFAIVRLAPSQFLCWTIRSAGPQVDDATLDRMFLNHPSADAYLWSLAWTLQDVQLPLDRMAVVGALFREAYLAGALRTATILEQAFREELQHFCASEWLQPMFEACRDELGSEFEHDVINSVIRFFAHRCRFTDKYEELPADDVAYPLYRASEPLVREILSDPDAVRREVSMHTVAFSKRVAASR